MHGIRFIPKIDNEGRLVLIGPQVKDLPATPNEPKPGTRRLKIVEHSGKDKKITDFMEFTITASNDGEEQLIVKRTL